MKRATAWVIAILIVLPAIAIALKVIVLGYRLGDVLPRTQYHVSLTVRLDGHGRDIKVRTFVPVTDDRQTVTAEEQTARELRLAFEPDGGNRLAVWTGGGVGDRAEARYAYSVLTEAVRYDLAPGLEVPTSYPEAVARQLLPEDAIQVDSPEVDALARRIGADRGDVRQRLERIYDFVSGLPQRPFKGTTDALTALRLGEASCNGKSRLMVALARHVGIPARLVGGLILRAGSKKTSHQWIEVYVGGHWVPMCPTNHHFAELPASYLVLYRGDQALFRHTADVNFDYRFTIATERVPSPKAKAAFKVWNVWALFDRLGLPFSLLRTILMLPIGALVVVVFRNVIGMPTFGTFLPALIAAAAGETGGLWGVVAVLILVAVVFVARAAVHRLELLHSPTLAILLAAVAVAILSTALLADHLGLPKLTRITMFPLAVMAITAERFYLSLTEQGARKAGKELAGTLVVMLACFAVMSSLALQVLLIGFPEVLLWVVAANIYLGRWVGLRLSEYLRFRPVLTPGAST